MVSLFMSTYYNVLIAYALYYFFTSFRSVAPWSDCSNRWNTKNCWHPLLQLTQNISKPNDSQTPSEEFYEYEFFLTIQFLQD